MADSWQENLLPLLKDEFGEASVEERVISASLRAVPVEMRAGVTDLFSLFAIFAEDAIVPAAAIDVVASLMPHASAIAAQQMRQTRRWMQQLLKANILRGSIEQGVAVHDIVRDFMIRRAEAAPEGGLRATQREAVRLFVDAFDAQGPASRYVSASLHWHVRQAQQLDVSIPSDPVLMRVITHEDNTIRKQASTGLGAERLQACAQGCDSAGQFLEAAQLMFAASSLRGVAAGKELKAAWASLQQLEEAGRGSSRSRILEGRVLGVLLITTEDGFAYGGDDHRRLLRRLNELGRERAPSRDQESLAGTVASKELMEAEFNRGIVAMLFALEVEHVYPCSEPITDERVEQAREYWHQTWWHMVAAKKSVPEWMPSHKAVLNCYCYFPAIDCARQHRLPDFSFEALCGKGGQWLKDTIDGYEHEKVHPIAMAFGFGIDIFMFGVEPLGLLLFAGDVAAARAGVLKVLDAHKCVLTRVQQGVAQADRYGYEGVGSFFYLPYVLRLMGDRELLRSFIANSLGGQFLVDEQLQQGVATFWNAWGSWRTDDGHIHSTQATFTLQVRALSALCDDGRTSDDASNRAALLEWLPPPSELLHIAEYECVWLAQAAGQHPSVLCATLYGEQLGNWEAAEEVAAGVLRREAFNPILRVECHRLQARASAALGRPAAACKAAERAVTEAAAARYAWLEMLSLRDMLEWCEASMAEDVRSRLNAAVGRISASAEELDCVLGAHARASSLAATLELKAEKTSAHSP